MRWKDVPRFAAQVLAASWRGTTNDIGGVQTWSPGLPDAHNLGGTPPSPVGQREVPLQEMLRSREELRNDSEQNLTP